MVGTFATMAQTAGVLMKVYDKIKSGEFKDDVAKNVKNTTNREMVLFQANGSIIRLLSTFIIEPTIVISKNLKEEEITEKLAEINVEIFSSFYLQAFNVLTNVYGFKSDMAFDILSSKGNMMKYTDSNKKFNFGIEEFDETLSILPIKDKSKVYLSLEDASTNSKLRKLAREIESHQEQIDRLNKLRTQANSEATDKLIKKHAGAISDISADIADIKKELAQDDMNKKMNNGKAGKASVKDTKGIGLPTMIQKEIEISNRITSQDGGGSYDVVIPVLIKANVIYSDFSNIETMISTNDRNKSFLSRLDEYRSGMISINDLIFADDLIKQYKSNKIKDKDNLIGFMENRATAANAKLITKKHIGLSKFYSCLVVSKNQMSIIEQKLGGSIVKPKYKEMLMDQTKSLLINVVDTDWERVQIHTKDLNGTSDLSYKIIKNKKGGTDSSDLVDVFKAISSNKPPVF